MALLDDQNYIDRERDYENRLNSAQVFDQMEEWPSDLEDFEHKLDSAVDGLLDHGPPKCIYHGIGADSGFLDDYEFDLNSTPSNDPNASLINLMKGIDATLKKRKSTFSFSLWGQLILIVLITVGSLMASDYLKKGVWLSPSKCWIGKENICHLSVTNCRGPFPFIQKMWCNKNIIEIHKHVLEKGSLLSK